ncbi:MAG: hypothetical protein ACRDH2_11030 [Anaerolineales bacterium]
MGYKVELMGVLWALATITMAVQRDEARVQAYLEESVTLARLAAQRGDVAEARMRAERLIAYSRERGERLSIINIQSQLAHGLRQHGDLEEALAIYRETIRGWQEFGHRAAVAHELECIACIAGAQGQNERAARLLGAAEALRELIGSPMTPLERVEYDQAVSTVRASMDEALFAKFWAEGQALPMEDAITYTLEHSAID